MIGDQHLGSHEQLADMPLRVLGSMEKQPQMRGRYHCAAYIAYFGQRIRICIAELFQCPFELAAELIQ